MRVLLRLARYVALAALALVVFVLLFASRLDGRGSAERSKLGAANIQIGTLRDRVEAYALDTGALPSDLRVLVSSLAPETRQRYLRARDLKDPWNRPFRYERISVDAFRLALDDPAREARRLEIEQARPR